MRHRAKRPCGVLFFPFWYDELRKSRDRDPLSQERKEHSKTLQRSHLKRFPTEAFTPESVVTAPHQEVRDRGKKIEALLMALFWELRDRGGRAMRLLWAGSRARVSETSRTQQGSLVARNSPWYFWGRFLMESPFKNPL